MSEKSEMIKCRPLNIDESPKLSFSLLGLVNRFKMMRNNLFSILKHIF